MDPSFSILPPPLSRAEVREVDRIAIERFGMTGLVLMENAGFHAASQIHAIAPTGDICLLCGKGNNGGDGYVIARHLELAGHQVRIVSVVEFEELTGDAAANYGIAARSGISCEVAKDRTGLESQIGNPALVIDCLLGTGATGAPRPPYSDAIQIANQLPSLRIAIDIPSGLDCDTGRPSDPTFIAHHTLTFVAPKIGFAAPEATPFVGNLIVLPIGVPLRLLHELCVSKSRHASASCNS